MILNKDCYTIIVGNSKFLPKAIEKAYVDCLSIENKINEKEAWNILTKYKKEGKFYIETW